LFTETFYHLWWYIQRLSISDDVYRNFLPSVTVYIHIYIQRLSVSDDVYRHCLPSLMTYTEFLPHLMTHRDFLPYMLSRSQGVGEGRNHTCDATLIVITRVTPALRRNSSGVSLVECFVHCGGTKFKLVLLYGHRDRRRYSGRGTRDVHLDFHTDDEL